MKLLQLPLRIAALVALTTFSGCGGDGIPEAEPREGIPADLQGQAPETFRAHFETSKGPFVIEVTRAWAPTGADRFFNLVSHGYLDDTRFFRTVEGFMTQFGIAGDPAVAGELQTQRIDDDPVVETNTRGRITFAMGGPNTRTTQLFINSIDNSRLDEMGFPPFGEVVEGMEVVDALYSGYGDGPPSGMGPNQGRIQGEGNTYLDADFPLLDQILWARIIDP
jgi:peptidyl-prolyl cis-trans isomerase A (cyclophilin A)